MIYKHVYGKHSGQICEPEEINKKARKDVRHLKHKNINSKKTNSTPVIGFFQKPPDVHPRKDRNRVPILNSPPSLEPAEYFFYIVSQSGTSPAQSITFQLQTAY